MPPAPPKCGPGSVTNKLIPWIDIHTCRRFNLPIFFPDKISSDLLCCNGLKLDVSVKEQMISQFKQLSKCECIIVTAVASFL